MKRGNLFAVSLILLIFFTAGFLAADEYVIRQREDVIESFDGAGSSTYPDGNAIVWKVAGSRFATEGYPKQTYVNTWPQDMFGVYPENKDALQVLGIRARFDRTGYNSIEVIPGKGDGQDWVPEGIPLPGRIKTFDIWVWGSMFDYTMELHLRDFEGIDHVLALGSLMFRGWKDLQVQIPSSIKQFQRRFPEYQGLRLTKFVIRTSPHEHVDDYYVYLDHITTVTDGHESVFDGWDLTAPDKRQEIWGSSDEQTGNNQGGQ